MRGCCAMISAIAILTAASVGLAAQTPPWIEELLHVPYATPQQAPPGQVPGAAIGAAGLRAIGGQPVRGPHADLTIGSRHFEHGLGTHSISEIDIAFAGRADAFLGVDRGGQQSRDADGEGSVVFGVSADGRQLFRSRCFAAPRSRSESISTSREPSRWSSMSATRATARPATTPTGPTPRSSRAGRQDLAARPVARGIESPAVAIPLLLPLRRPPGDELLPGVAEAARPAKAARRRTHAHGHRPGPIRGRVCGWSGRSRDCADFPAVEWVLWFSNTGKADTPILADVQALEPGPGRAAPAGNAAIGCTGPTALRRPRPISSPRWSPWPRGHASRWAAAAGGRPTAISPSSRSRPAAASYIMAVGWSGQWHARLDCRPDGRPARRRRAWSERTSGCIRASGSARRRSCCSAGPATRSESNAQFRQLIYKHYAARRNGRRPAADAVLQHLLHPRRRLAQRVQRREPDLAHPGLRAAGAGGPASPTPAGSRAAGPPGPATGRRARTPTRRAWGRWPPRPRQHGMVYGLWFEPERVVAGTAADQEPSRVAARAPATGRRAPTCSTSACPRSGNTSSTSSRASWSCRASASTAQDFNMDPLAYWRHSDAARPPGDDRDEVHRGPLRLLGPVGAGLARQPARGVRQRRPAHRPGNRHAHAHAPEERLLVRQRGGPGAHLEPEPLPAQQRVHHAARAAGRPLVPLDAGHVADPRLDRRRSEVRRPPGEAVDGRLPPVAAVAWSGPGIRCCPTRATAGTGWPRSTIGRTWTRVGARRAAAKESPRRSVY